ncbi:circadian locomoter output cycles protein kaput [Culicoides brevitarsis]|uniref:circadian locomoter output cycles protein kaput n=1 Tax=Culicoides brevitarsis TaxID=469753 RepID=UPI00307BB0A0
MSNNMDDDNDDKDDTKRKSRNLSEKKRRDQFNMLVNELSSMVSANNRKMDKSTVLKSTISFLKNHNEISVRSRAHEIKEDWKPSFLSNEEFTHLILEALDGFIMVFSSSGKVFYASEGITSLLGHLPSDLLNMSIYDIVYEEDQTTLYNILLNPTAVVEPLQTGINCENQIIFSLHMKRGTFNAQETVSYEPVQFVGYFRMESEMDSNATRTNYANDQEGRVIFVGTGRLQTPQLIREMSVLDTKSEFTSRHSLEWKFLFLDHRAPPIIGYLPFEVLGTSGYDYYHFDDLDKVVTCHEALMQKGEGTSCFYRFLTKGQQWIWLQTRFYITYHQWNSKPEFVVCTHRVVSHSDVLKHHRGITMSSEEKENEDFDASGSERKHNVSVPVTGLSPWSKSSRASKFVSNSSSPRPTKQHRHYRHNVGNTSDSTSISADSPNSRYSHVSSFSSRSRARHHNQPLRSSSSQNYHHHSMSSQQMQQPQSSYYQNPMVPMTSQLPHHSRDAQATHQMLAPTTFIETAPFVAAIPVQPVIAAPATFGHPTVIQQIPHSSTHLDYLHASNVILTPAQNQIQDQLQRKHEELQHLIQQQQDELRRVSEQLMIARYGVIPVGVPYSTANSPTVVDNRYMTPNQPNLLQPQSLQMMGHSPTSNANAAYQPLTHHQQHSEQSNSSTDLPPNAASSQEYIQLELTSAPNPQMMMSNVSANVAMPGQSRNSADILQFQMNQEQAQSLFDNSGSERSVITSASHHQN